jgi:hypothetical protein
MRLWWGPNAREKNYFYSIHALNTASLVALLAELQASSVIRIVNIWGRNCVKTSHCGFLSYDTELMFDM